MNASSASVVIARTSTRVVARTLAAGVSETDAVLNLEVVLRATPDALDASAPSGDAATLQALRGVREPAVTRSRGPFAVSVAAAAP